jgi:hypothetical protein
METTRHYSHRTLKHITFSILPILCTFFCVLRVHYSHLPLTMCFLCYLFCRISLHPTQEKYRSVDPEEHAKLQRECETLHKELELVRSLFTSLTYINTPHTSVPLSLPRHCPLFLHTCVRTLLLRGSDHSSALLFLLLLFFVIYYSVQKSKRAIADSIKRSAFRVTKQRSSDCTAPRTHHSLERTPKQSTCVFSVCVCVCV